MTTQAIVALGIGQCVNWGVLYYAFSVLLTPLSRDLGVPGWVLASAFSLALLVSALAAPTVGRWSDRGAGLQLVHSGGYVAAAVLLIWSLLPGLHSLFFVWTILGLCMAATLYEPVFAIVGRTLDHPGARLRALATVTVFGGLASTVFLPLTALLVERWGWRPAVGVLAATLAVSTCISSRVVARGGLPHSPPPTPARRGAPIGGRFHAILGLFSVASLATTAFTTTLVPALIAREVTPMGAAWLGGLLGLMQLPGRVLVMHGALRASPSRLLAASLLAQAAGIALIAIAGASAPLAAGVTIFAVGAGLMTLARPHLVQTVFNRDQAGYLNGRLAGAQNLARAGGPVLAVSLAGVVGYGVMFGVLATIVAALAIASTVVIDV
jgi:predicted MFS family arabinose efflux permease